MEGVKDSAAAGKRLQWDSIRSSTAVGSKPREGLKGEGREVERHDNVEQPGGQVFFFGRHQSLTHHNKWMFNGRTEVEKYRH